jgi:monothiol glutaredoxin
MPPMERALLPHDRVHPAIREKIATNHREIVDEVRTAVSENDLVVVGMTVNTAVKRARKLFTARGLAHRYLEYGGYLSQWRRRNALKMWTGWPTFPMVFVKGILIGGAADLDTLAQSGELEKMLGRS